MIGDNRAYNCNTAQGAVTVYQYLSATWTAFNGAFSRPNGSANDLTGSSVAIGTSSTGPFAYGSQGVNVGGNANAGEFTLYRALTTTDSTAPTLSLNQACSSVQSDPTNTSPVKFYLSANETLDSSTVTAADFTVTNGTVASIACDNARCTINVTPTTAGVVTIAVSGSFSVSDSWGNASLTASSTDSSVTYDNVAPTLVSSTPADNSSNIALNSNIVLTFSESVTVQGSFYFYLNKQRAASLGAVSVEPILSTGARVTVTDSKTLTIDPTNDFVSGTEYYIYWLSGIVKDLAGNSIAAMSAPGAIGNNTSGNLTWTTGADTVAPTLSSYAPYVSTTSYAISAAPVLEIGRAHV